MAHSQLAWLHSPKEAPRMLSSILPSILSSILPLALDSSPSLLDCTLPSQLSIHFQEYLQVHTQVLFWVSWQNTPRYPVKHTPCWIHWHTLCLLGSVLPNTLSTGKTLPISLDYIVPCMHLCTWSWDLQSRRHQAPRGMKLLAGGRWQAVGGGWLPVNGGRNNDIN
jgi:hypothetical protein